jgi:hypothetical protein
VPGQENHRDALHVPKCAAAEPDLVGNVDATAPHRFRPEFPFGLKSLDIEAYAS